MNHNEREASIRRHPSWNGEARLYALNTPTTLEGNERANHRALLTIAAQLHDYFRYGDPKATGSLEAFLAESGIGGHAEVLLDELAALTSEAIQALVGPGGEAA